MAPTPDPATAAQGLLREFEERYKLTDVPPVPVDRIATSLLGLFIDEHDDIRSLPNAPADRGRLSGMLDIDEMTIWVDREEARRSSGRRRFTIAHEIGHFRMHVPENGVFVDGRSTINEIPLNGDGKAGGKDSREREADDFARELLMPELLVTEHARATGFNLPALAGRFAVSVPAVRLRLRFLGILPRYMT